MPQGNRLCAQWHPQHRHGKWWYAVEAWKQTERTWGNFCLVLLHCLITLIVRCYRSQLRLSVGGLLGQGDCQPCPLVCVTSLLLACGNVVGLYQRGLTRGDSEDGCSSCHCLMQPHVEGKEKTDKPQIGSGCFQEQMWSCSCWLHGGAPHPVQLLVLRDMCCLSVNFLLLTEAGSCSNSWHLSGHSCMGMQAESTAQPSPPSSDLGVIKGQCLQHCLWGFCLFSRQSVKLVWNMKGRGGGLNEL